MTGTKFSIEVLPASDGDCLWVEWGDSLKPFRMLIDGGRAQKSKISAPLAERIGRADPKRIDLIVATHIDDDHISGLVPFFSDLPAGLEIGDVWFNSLKHLPASDELGSASADRLANALEAQGLPWNANAAWAKTPRHAVVRHPARSLPVIDIFGLHLTLLSPTIEQLDRLRAEWPAALRAEGMDEDGSAVKEGDVLGYGADQTATIPELRRRSLGSDSSKPNASSIAFIAEYEGRTVLFAADAIAPVIVDGLRLWRPDGEIRFDAIKMSHHGSENNLSDELLALVRCHDWLISTDGSLHHHPNRRAIAHLTWKQPGCRLLFNYRSDMTAEWGQHSLQTKWGFSAVLPDDGTFGLTYNVLSGEATTGDYK